MCLGAALFGLNVWGKFIETNKTASWFFVYYYLFLINVCNIAEVVLFELTL